MRPDALGSKRLELMDRHGMAIACVSNLRVLRHDFVSGNALVSDALGWWPDHFRGHVAINLLRTREELASALARHLGAGRVVAQDGAIWH